MLMAQSDARFEYKANHAREAQRLKKDPFAFTCAAGMLVPIFSDFASPGDTYYIQHDLDYMRTNPLAKPAMIDVKVHYESFFVPMQMIYQPFEQTVFSLKDLQSSLYNLNSLMNNNFPLFDYASYVNAVKATSTSLNYLPDAFRFADYMQLSPLNFVGTTLRNSNAYEPNFFPWAVMAYHAIFNYVYRLDDKTQFLNDSFNWDQYYATSQPVQFGGSSGFFQIYQRPWDFDYFTSLYRSPIVSDANVQKVLPILSSGYSDLASVGTSPLGSTGLGVTDNARVRTFGNYPDANYVNYNVAVNTGTAAIRQMFANEKLAMITGRTRKTYDAQVLAHYGVKIPHDPKHDIAKIGRDTYDLRIGEVTSLADSASTPLGELAGKGYAFGQGHEHKFTAPSHGVVMTIFSVEPRKKYTGGFARKHAVTTAFDFPVPEFDRLGNQPMFRYEVGNRYINPSDPSDETLMTDQIGWNKRYQQWKNQPAYATCAFMGSTSTAVNDFNAYMIATEPFGVVDVTNAGGRNGSSRPDLEDRFYIDRHCTDGIMLMPYADGWKAVSGGENWNDTPWLAYVRDPFIVNSFEKVSKVSWMSVDGEPIYPY